MFSHESEYFIKCSQSDLKKILLNIPFDLLKLSILALPQESQKRILKNLVNPIAEDLLAYVILKNDLISWNVISEMAILDACSEANRVISGLSLSEDPKVLPDFLPFAIHDIAKLTDEELREVLAQLDEDLLFFSFLETNENIIEKISNILPKKQAVKFRSIARLKNILYECRVVEPISVLENEGKISDIIFKIFPDKNSDNSFDFYE